MRLHTDKSLDLYYKVSAQSKQINIKDTHNWYDIYSLLSISMIKPIDINIGSK